MNMPNLNQFKKIAAVGLCLSFAVLFAACDKVPFFKESTGDGNPAEGNPGIVQTDWREGDQKTAVDKLKLEAGTETKPLQPIRPQQEKASQPAPVSPEFAVQIGAFLEADNAKRLITRLQKKGYQPSLVVVETPAKKWNLVRMGSYADKKSAEMAAQKFTSAEQMETAVVKDRVIVKMQTKTMPSPTPEARKATTAPKAALPETVAKFEPEKFSFQVGGLRTKAVAESYSRDLKKQGYAPFIKAITTYQSGETWYSVRIGTFDTIDQAADAAAAFTARETIPTQAVSMNN